MLAAFQRAGARYRVMPSADLQSLALAFQRPMPRQSFAHGLIRQTACRKAPTQWLHTGPAAAFLSAMFQKLHSQ